MIVGGDPRDPKGRWLVEVGVQAPGVPAPLRWSTEALVVLDSAGREVPYASGLADLALSGADGAEADRGTEVDVSVWDPSVDWARLDPATPCVVRRWLPGSPLEASEVYARGTLSDLDYGAPEDAATWTVGDALEVALMLDPAARVDDITWPLGTADAPLGGEWEATDYHTASVWYPLVFGRPVAVPVVCPRRTTNGSYYFDPWFVISADPATFLPGEAGDLRPWMFVGDEIVAPIESEVYPAEVATLATDGRGRSVGTLHAYSRELGVTLAPAADEPVTLWLPHATDPAYPIVGIRNLADVLDYVLGKWAAGSVDWGRMAAVRGDLEAYLVDTWVNDRVPVWAWVSELLAETPFRVRVGPQGRYVVAHRIATHPSLTVRTVDVDLGEAVRVGRVRRRAGADFAWVEVEYAANGSPQGPEHFGFSVYGPEADTDTYAAGQVRVHPILVAASLAGHRGLRAITLDWTHDDDTAARVAEYQIERDALPHREVDLLVPERWGLREGDQIAVTDSTVGLDRALAIVDAPPEITEEGVTVTLRLPGV